MNALTGRQGEIKVIPPHHPLTEEDAMQQIVLPTNFVNSMKVPPTFHEVRKYLTPITYKGERILANVGACKQSGCKWTNQYANWAGLAAGIWQHRQGHIQQRRYRKLDRLYRGDTNQIREGLRLAADHSTHTEEAWVMAVTRTMRDLEPRGTFQASDFRAQLMTYYAMGMMALQAAQRIYDLHFAMSRAI
jgi:hypothetical protein